MDSTAESVIELVLEGHGVRGPPLRPTAGHPIFSETAQNWVRAGALKVGDQVRTHGGRTPIAEIRRFPGAYRVFNLEVEGDHEYFAGEQRVLSHNSGTGLTCAGAGGGAVSNVSLPSK